MIVFTRIDDRLIKIDAKQGEFLLFHIFFALFHHQMNSRWPIHVPIKAAYLTELIGRLPDAVLPAYRRKRTYTSSLLSKNETDSANPYGKKLFKRKRTGWYMLNPKLSVRYKDEWTDLYRHAGLELIEAIGRDSSEYFQKMIDYVRGEGPQTTDESALQEEDDSANQPDRG